MSGLKIREFKPSDYGPFLVIHDSLYPAQPFFLERRKHEDSCFERTRYRMKRIVAENESGEVIAVGGFNHLFFEYHPRKFSLNIEVHPEWPENLPPGRIEDTILPQKELKNSGRQNGKL